MIYELSGLGMKLNHMEAVVRGTNVGEIMQKLSDAENETTILQNEVDTLRMESVGKGRHEVHNLMRVDIADVALYKRKQANPHSTEAKEE